MGLFIAAGTSSQIDGGTKIARFNALPSVLVQNATDAVPVSLKVSTERLDALRKQQAEVIEIINIGEAINARDFQERCAEDNHLTELAFEASQRMLQEVEVQDFVSSLPNELAELVDLLDEGLTTREIAKIKGVVQGTIQYRVEKLRSITRAYFASAVAA
jgi:DNA-directed RNA polymerase specialized sigma24 family protein